MRESVGMSLMGVPSGIDLDEVEARSASSTGWRRSTTFTSGR